MPALLTFSGAGAAGLPAGGSLSLSGTGALSIEGISGALSFSGTATATPLPGLGSLELGGGVLGEAVGEGGLTLGAQTAGLQAETSTAGSIDLAGAESSPVTGEATLSLGGSGGGGASAGSGPAVATGSLSFAGAAAALAATRAIGSGSLSLAGTGFAQRRNSATGSLTLAGYAVAVSGVFTISSVAFTGSGSSSIDIDDGMSTELIVLLHTPSIEAAPSSITVSVLDAMGLDDVVFSLADTVVFTLEPDADGNLDLATIPVPALQSGGSDLMTAGTHTLTVTQGSASGTVTFVIENDPAPVPEALVPDAAPVAVPGALQSNGVRRWVLQDLAVGGIGSWIMPMNPAAMSSPAFKRELSVKTTTASAEAGGQFHISENASTPVEWTFSGLCPTKQMRDKLEEYADLNRRLYLHDHRGRAWKVAFADLQLRPRLSTNWNGVQTDEVHDYEATVMVLDREWVDV